MAGGVGRSISGAAAAARSWLAGLPGRAQQGVAKRGGAVPAAEAAVKEGAGVVGRAAKKVHGAVQKRLFEGEAPTLYRFRGDKYSHCYGAPKRDTGKNMQHLAPYITTGVLACMGIFFIAMPIMHQQSYSDSKRRYEAFARQHSDALGTQFDRGQFSDMGRPRGGSS
eukprot:TRINITY_DN62826_c0_g1_i1.p1 TRINITY_DN62826_c0_g1~~TRINITY_DN62826_c0_g1_i1.p1  ORF type:complete len:167 (+),score=17.56 TRINITY_DN62826_c0_g1_i1:89-589(+)